VLSRIQHPAVPRIHDSGVAAGELFFVTDLVDGVDLRSEMRRRGPWPIAEAASLAATIADALAAAHGLGIVHRDVKPSNVMLARDGSVKLLDFGLARGGGVDMTTLTRTGAIVGTPSYMSPEQFDAHGVDERSDVYSLGVVLYELLTGRLPFGGTTPVAVALQHKSEPVRAPRNLRPDLPVWLDHIVLRCLEKDPRRRFLRAVDLAAELRRARPGGALRSRPLPTGDVVIEDAAEATDWALSLLSQREKTGWSPGMALRFSDRYYRLARVEPPRPASGRWTYRFATWPEGEVFRRLVDYENDTTARDAPRGLGSKLSKWIGRKE
jgi:serine/threonine protein kinase